MNVRTHTRWMRSNPSPSLSPSPGCRCHFYRGPLRQPDTVRTRTVSDTRHASDTALPRAADRPMSIGRAVSDACRRPTLFGPTLCRVALCSVSHDGFLQKACHSIFGTYMYILGVKSRTCLLLHRNVISAL